MDLGELTELLPLIISVIGGFIFGIILIFKREYSHMKPLIEVIRGKEPFDNAAIIRAVFLLDLIFLVSILYFKPIFIFLFYMGVFIALCLWFKSIGAWDYPF